MPEQSSTPMVSLNQQVSKLERELLLKQLQITHLLTITQAINNNLGSEELFNMYRSFLNWEMGVKKMALYFREDFNWTCNSFIGISEDLLRYPIEPHLKKFDRLSLLKDSDHPLFQEFEVIIPVLHKKSPIAYVLIGGFGEQEEYLYNNIQFITTITNIIAVAIENKRLFKRQLEQERLKREMELASQMQRLLIPTQLPKNDKYELASVYKPQMGVGGDYFDCIEFPDGKFTFCIGDISGKGVAAALLMANFQANFNNLINEYFQLENFIRALNRSVLRITNGDKFITFFVAEYNPATQMLYYINAGHNPPILYQNGEVTLLTTGCTILGNFQELPEVQTGSIKLTSETLIFTYTDGFSDIKNDNDDFLNQDIAISYIQKYHHLPAEELNSALMEEIYAFKQHQHFPDDFTLLTCKIYS